MKECPSHSQLAGLLTDEFDQQVVDQLTDHLGQCEHCRELIQILSVDSDDWKGWESMLAGQEVTWPDSERLTPNQMRLTNDTIDLADTNAFGRMDVAPQPAPKTAVRDFGDYVLLGLLGSGGMGDVFRARQKSANRVVALKLIRREKLESQSADRRRDWLERFRVEAQTAAQLEHDHIVRIYDVGDHRGTLFYSMQLIDGKSLAEIIRPGPIENRRAAGLMRRIALAVHYAHEKGILHRDIKPQNILVRQYSSSTMSETAESDVVTVTNERPFVADFGLAKLLEGASGTTQTGEVMGSPSYMSPEQAQDASRCTVRSDVYSLGATLYDILTGRPPFQAFSALETLRQVIDAEPVAPRNLNPAIDRDLQTITLKTLAKEPARRYATALELADDLRRYELGEPIHARPISTAGRSWLWCRRNPAVALLAVGVALLLFMGALGIVAHSIRVSQYATRESVARTEAESYLSMALDVIDQMLADFGDESLADVPQMENVRKELLRKALNLQLQLLATKPTNRSVRVEFARAQHRIGKIHKLLGEQTQARAAFQQAIVQFEDLRQDDPSDDQLRHFLATSHTMHGETWRKSSPSQAQAAYEAAIALQNELKDASPAEVDFQIERARTLNNLGLLLTETGKDASAEVQLVDAAQTLSDLLQRGEAQANVYADLGRSQINLGVLLRKQTDRKDEAKAAYEDAIENLKQAVGLDSENRDFRFRLSVALIDLGNFLTTDAKDARAGLDITLQANKGFRVLCDEFPGFPLYRYELANSHNSLAVAMAGLKRFDDAKVEFHNASQVLDKMLRDFPDYALDMPEYQSLKGRVLGGLGYLHSLGEELKTAENLVDQAIQCQQEAADRSPENPQFLSYLSQHHSFRADVLDRLGLPEQAQLARQTAESLERQAAEMKHPPNTDDKKGIK